MYNITWRKGRKRYEEWLYSLEEAKMLVESLLRDNEVHTITVKKIRANIDPLI